METIPSPFGHSIRAKAFPLYPTAATHVLPRRYALWMQSIVLEIPRYAEPTWLQDIVHEFTEDPYCLSLMLGVDEETVMLVTIWDDAVAAEVEAGLLAMTDSNGRVRRLELSIPDNALEIPQ